MADDPTVPGSEIPAIPVGMTPSDVLPPAPTAPEIPSPVAPPVDTPVQAEPAPEPPRHYINRSFGFTFNGTFIQGNLFDTGAGADIDGWYGDKEFTSGQDLIKVANLTQDQNNEVMTTVQRFINRR